MCGWCYWVNNILYYPNLLMSTAVVGTYAIGPGRDRAGGQLDLRAAGHAGGALAGGVAQHRRASGPDAGCRTSARIGTYLPGVLLVGLGRLRRASPDPSATPMDAAQP